MGFDEDDCDYAKGFTSSVDEVTEKDSYSATAIDEKPRDYKQDELVSMMNKIALETSSVLGYPEAVCRILLHHYKWDKETLLERFYECTDVDAFFKSAHLTDPNNVKKRTEASRQCSICYERRQLTGLACGHVFCYECWDRYLVSKRSIRIADEGGAYLQCPEHKCGLIIDDDTALSLIKCPLVQAKYVRLVVNSFVESNPLMASCPGTDCGRIVELTHAKARPITCDCGYTFCSSCSHAWHDPVGCDLLKTWLKKCSEPANWLNAKTEVCPKCQLLSSWCRDFLLRIAVEKDAGSDHMMCGNVSCRFEFCICPMCLGPWDRNGCYACNNYDETTIKRARNPQERSRAALRRYLHYRNRYTNHQNSLKLEHKILQSVHAKMEQMEQHGFSWTDTHFLKRAVDVLSEARRTLMYAHAFAFYLVQNTATKLFEDNLQDLQLATEQLSEFVERDLDNEDISLAAFAALKQKVEDKYRYVDQRRHMLLKHCAEGKVKGEWKFNADVE
ncbi:ubiquitin-conjugating enzyme E2-binding protein 1 [Aphelenchoides avenae]|nr:ubiquitin-conjugating enzyme E2-binding protein 1 [Aphelenchus avenae]